jgi:hypothetical protein
LLCPQQPNKDHSTTCYFFAGPDLLLLRRFDRGNGYSIMPKPFGESCLDMRHQFHEAGNSGATLAGNAISLHIMAIERGPNYSGMLLF